MNTITLLLSSPIRVFVRSEVFDEPGDEMSLGEYAQQVFGVFDWEPPADVLELLLSVPASADDGVVIGPDYVRLVEAA